MRGRERERGRERKREIAQAMVSLGLEEFSQALLVFVIFRYEL